MLLRHSRSPQWKRCHTRVDCIFLILTPRRTPKRSFGVSLQGHTVIAGLDIMAAAGRPQKTIVREFRDVSIGNELTIDLVVQHGQTILSGVEIVREQE